MKCAIMQPHFLPWSGYFNLLSKVDKFVFLDDSQYSKNSWHNRNYIIVNKRKYLINIPVLKSELRTNIKDILVDQSKGWKSKFSKTVSQSYSNHQHYEDLNELINYILSLKTKKLSEYNIKIIKFISRRLNIKTQFLCSSDLNVSQMRTHKLINILNVLNANEYVSPIGAKDYLTGDKFENLTNIRLSLNEFNGKEYNQFKQKEFIKNLSIIDVIANLGWKNSELYIRNLLGKI